LFRIESTLGQKTTTFLLWRAKAKV
jgi:hypothetical protein